MTRVTPRISLSKLGEYLSASAGRRRVIIKDQQEPKEFITTRYKEARSAIVDYFVRYRDPLRLAAIADDLRNRSGTDYQVSDFKNSALAIKSFMGVEMDFGDGIETLRGDGRGSLPLAGVSVSIAPDLIIRGTRRGKMICGAVKLYIVKGHPLQTEAGLCAASILQKWVEGTLADATVSRDHCIILDVFAKQVHRSPKATRRRLDDVEAACQEIADRWGNV